MIYGLLYDDKYYEDTLQYNHPMKEYDFYNKKIDDLYSEVVESRYPSSELCSVK